MADFDSPLVRDLVEEASSQSPLASTDIRERLIAAQQDPQLSARDRGQLLLCGLITSQANMDDRESAHLAEMAVVLLQKGGDEETLLTALAMSAAIHAMAGDMRVCLDRCLDLVDRTNTTGIKATTPRTLSNFGVALLAIGAYELASDAFAKVITQTSDDYKFMPMLVATFNLTLSVSRVHLIHAEDVTKEPYAEWLELIDQGVREITDHDDAPRAHEFLIAIRTHIAFLRGDAVAASAAWGDLDSLRTEAAGAFTRYFCLVETRVALHRGDFERALLVANRAMKETDERDFLPLRRAEATLLRSEVHEHMGATAEALVDARQGAALALRKTTELPDVLIGQVNERALLQETRRQLLAEASELTEQAHIDELSQIGNRRAYERVLTNLQASQNHAIAILSCDIDDFKSINDRFGHGVGDRVIARVGAILNAVCRSQDQTFRYGGDEFVVLAAASLPNGPTRLAERLHQAFASAPWEEDGLIDPVTCSIGIASGPSQAIAAVASEADRQLYEAKKAGRSCIRPTRDADDTGSSSARWL